MSWPLVSIKSVGKVYTGKTPSKLVPEYFGGDIPFITPTELNKEIYVNSALQTITELGATQITVVPKNAIMVCCIGSLGKIGIAQRPLATKQQINSIVFDENKVFPKYGYYACSRLKPILESLAPATTIAIINKSRFEALEIPRPPLAEQKRFAAILDKADSLRRKNQQAIQLADQFLRAVFLDLFGDPVTNPRGWEVKKWQEVLSIINGKNQKKVEVGKGGYPIYGSGGSEMGRANDYLCFENSIIIGRKGNINKPILIKEKFWNVDTAFGLTSKKELISFQYLYWFCKFFDFEKLNKTVTIPSLTKSDLLEIEMPIPSMDLQIRFEKICTKIDSQNILVQLGSIKVNNLFNSLSQKAFAGEL